MPGTDVWKSHDLVPDQEVKVVGQTYKQRRCERCRRNFVIPPGGREWRAVYVGVFEFTLLDDETNRRWLSEQCPGHADEVSTQGN
jgi:hypothetical protein